jgi:hypothetical protein
MIEVITVNKSLCIIYSLPVRDRDKISSDEFFIFSLKSEKLEQLIAHKKKFFSDELVAC